MNVGVISAEKKNMDEILKMNWITELDFQCSTTKSMHQKHLRAYGSIQ